MANNFARISATKIIDVKRYTLKDTFVSKGTARRLKARYKRQGYLVRVIQRGGVMHFLKRYHVYVRKG